MSDLQRPQRMRQPSPPLPTERQREGRTYSHCTRSAFSDILFFSKLFPLLRASFSKYIYVWQRTYEAIYRTSPLEPLFFSFSYDVGERLRLILALRHTTLDERDAAVCVLDNLRRAGNLRAVL